MKIAIISPGPFAVPPINGSSVEHDIDQVSRVLARDHTVLVYSRVSRAYPRSSQTGNLHHIRVPYRGARLYVSRILRDLGKRDVDAVLIENRPSFVAPIRRAFPHLPLVVNMHSHVFASPGVIAPARMRRAIREMDGMITNSRYLRRYFIRRHRVPAERVDAVYLGIDASLYNFSADEWRHRLRRRVGFRPDDRVLFFAGRLMPEKGVHILLKSFRDIARRDPRARLLIVGGTGYGSNRTNSYVKQLHRLAKPLGNRVRFVKFIRPNHMPRWYQAADLVATPSLWAEPFCRVNLEAMASGKPVLTTTRGGIPEVVADKQTGFCVSPGNWPRTVPRLWKELWRNEEKRLWMGEQAARLAARFSWEDTAQGYLTALEKAIHQRRLSGSA